MSCLLQICSISVLIYWIDIANGTLIFQEFSVHKDVEVKLKPFQFNPKEFFIEKWSPFGRFGFRKSIQKRDLGVISGELPALPVVPPAPVFEHNEEADIEERKENIETPGPLQPGPDPVKSYSSNVIRVPSTENLKPPTEGLYTSIGRNPSVINNNLGKPAQQNLDEFYGELPPRPMGPVPAQQFNFVPVQPVTSTPVQPVPNEVVPLITSPPRPAVVPNIPFSEIPPTDGPIVRGSKLALYFGNVFLQLVSQFMANARLQLNQYSSQRTPPPVPVPTNA